MKTLVTVMASIIAFSTLSQACQLDATILENAALGLAKINNPEGEITAKLVSSKGAVYKIMIDDNYGTYTTTIKTKKSENGFCRIKSITE